MIAVIIPTYNRAASLKRAIDSVQAQTYRQLEIIVVDDGSEDETAAVVHRYANCRYVKIGHSGLPAVARNAGARVTDAAYLAFLDSDDQWFPHKLETEIEAAAKTACGLICSNASLNGVRPYLSAPRKHSGQVLTDLMTDNFVITSSVVVRRDLFERARGFWEDPRVRGLEDYDLWLRLAAFADFHYIDEELLLYNRSIESLSHTRSMLSHWQGMELIFARVAEIINEDETLAKLLNRQVAACRRSICDEYLASSDYRGFMKSFGILWRTRPLAAVTYPATMMWNSLRR